MKKIAVFGSARVKEDTNLYKAAVKLGAFIVENGWVAVTGGGPGIMCAINQGALSAKKDDKTVCSIAQAIYLPFETGVNPYVEEYEQHETFYSRLKTFADCDLFVVLPGGIGTLLEMAMIYQLVQAQHMDHKVIICVGRMWREFKNFIQEEMVENNFLNNEEMKLVHYVDRFSEARHLLKGLL
jgi:uncharacterized protein (TIGR00730 family)